MSSKWVSAVLAALSLGGGMPYTIAAEVPLIPREALFGNPVRTQARLSPDGRYISFLAPKDGVLNVWLAPYGKLDEARPITDDRMRGIRQHFWAPGGRHVLYLQDQAGDENWHVYSVDVESGRQIDLTPLKGVQAQVVGLSHRRPEFVLVGLNDRTPEWHDLYEIDIRSGERKLVQKNDQGFAGFLEDLDLRPRIAVKTLAEGGELYRLTDKGWERFLTYGQEDSLTTGPIVIEGDGNRALLVSSVGRDKAALVRLDLATGEQSVVAEGDKADISNVWIEPKSRAPQAYEVNYLVPEVTPIVPEVAKDIERLRSALGPQFQVASRTLDDRKWVVVVDDPVKVLSTYVYDRDTGSVTKLFDQRPQLANAPLQPMWPVEIRARDGLTLVSYLTLPPGSDSNNDGIPDEPVPMVLNVHGGPWARDAYGFDPEHQWLANRGYAVLSVNYRGSTGFGKKFVNAGDREWAGKMHQDLLDAVEWAVRQKIALENRIAIYGGSYGGYATLVGLTFTPDRFACGVDIVGPSNLMTLLGSIPPYWKAFYEEFARRVGDPRTEEGQKLLKERSPLTYVERISRPLLIAQGANDPRVKQAESDQIVAAMKEKNLPVTYVLYPDEGHGFARPQNRISFYAIAEGFLAKCLGGRFEPIGNDFDGSSLKVLEGAEHVPGLAEAAKAREVSPAARSQ
ncbi:MAG: S9 family peptidase [Pseudomonadota bacterium]|nr:MAG: S9 family peptidase [Pseudomonadota bacterium]